MANILILDSGTYFDFQLVLCSEEHKQAAIYVYKHKEDTIE